MESITRFLGCSEFQCQIGGETLRLVQADQSAGFSSPAPSPNLGKKVSFDNSSVSHAGSTLAEQLATMRAEQIIEGVPAVHKGPMLGEVNDNSLAQGAYNGASVRSIDKDLLAA